VTLTSPAEEKSGRFCSRVAGRRWRWRRFHPLSDGREINVVETSLWMKVNTIKLIWILPDAMWSGWLLLARMWAHL
jgi:hypothetical protein